MIIVKTEEEFIENIKKTNPNEIIVFNKVFGSHPEIEVINNNKCGCGEGGCC